VEHGRPSLRFMNEWVIYNLLAESVVFVVSAVFFWVKVWPTGDLLWGWLWLCGTMTVCLASLCIVTLSLSL
jgi:hypothetical protein